MRFSKKAQIEANKEVLEALDRYNDEVKGTVLHHGKRLRTCQAYVYETPSFLCLKKLQNSSGNY